MMSVSSSSTAISMDKPSTVARKSMIGFPNAKINVGLQVRCRRPDGFHDIESLFVPIPWCDSLELESGPDIQKTSLEQHGLPIPGNPSDNLIVRAHTLLGELKPLPPVRFHLIKAIPMGAGLGGGSSDGAFALRLLNGFFNMGLSDSALCSLAEQLGSDCPFFIHNTSSHVTGRGENVRPITLNLKDWWVTLIFPSVHIPTASAFEWVTPNADRQGLDRWQDSSPVDWKGQLENDFTAPVAARFPAVRQGLDLLNRHGAAFADMSGSGSTIYGCFPAEPPAALFAECPRDWAIWFGKMTP